MKSQISQSLLFLSAAALISSAQAVTLLENFAFGDDAGTGLANTANDGTVATPWDFNFSGQPGEGATDGAGNLIIGFNAAAGSAGISKDYTRKVTFASALTTGEFVFEYRLNNWDLDATATANAGGAQSQGITFKLKNIAGDTVNLISALNNTSSNARARHAGSGSVTGTAGQTNIGTTGSDLVVTVRGDLDTGNYTTSYNLGGVGETAVITDGAGLTSINEILLTVEGTTAWSSNDFVGVDYAKLELVPEPSSAALLGLGGLALILRRRK